MAQGGRPIDSVWKYFIKVEDGGKIRAKCIKCNTMISAKAARLRSHLEKCSQRELQYNSPNDDIAEVIPIVNSSDSILPFKKHVLCHKIYQPKLNDFTIKTNSHQKEILDDQIARLFYACNLPFSLAENDVFKKTISILRPGYTPPTRKSIAGGLLDKIYIEVTTMAASALEGKEVTLLQDGWSDIHNSLVIAHCVHTEERSYFLNSVDTGSNKKTATYCTSLAIEASKEATAKFGCKVVAVVTDNEYKMQSMRSKLKILDSSLSVYGCASHLLNLLGKDITSSQIISHVTEINKYFRNHHSPGALLSQQNGSLKPQLPVVTRWNSQMECIKTYLTNIPFLLNILAQHEDVIDLSIVNLINNVGLYREAKNLYDQLKPISISLDKLQGEKSNNLAKSG